MDDALRKAKLSKLLEIEGYDGELPPVRTGAAGGVMLAIQAVWRDAT
jgi:hypothetical protein